jgi:hypothetical protein
VDNQHDREINDQTGKLVQTAAIEVEQKLLSINVAPEASYLNTEQTFTQQSSSAKPDSNAHALYGPCVKEFLKTLKEQALQHKEDYFTNINNGVKFHFKHNTTKMSVDIVYDVMISEDKFNYFETIKTIWKTKQENLETIIFKKGEVCLSDGGGLDHEGIIDAIVVEYLGRHLYSSDFDYYMNKDC